jgi:hypothetical protein
MKNSLNLEKISKGSFIIMFFLNFAACIIPINKKTTIIETVGFYPNLLSPADCTFYVWPLILLLLAGFTFFSMFQRHREQSLYGEQFYVSYIIMCYSNIVWIFALSYNYLALSVMFSTTGLISLCRINHLMLLDSFSMGIDKIIRLPFQMYFGWLMITTTNGILVLLLSIGWAGVLIPEEFFALLLLIVLTVITAVLVLKYHDIVACFTVIWAYSGIFAKHILKTEWNRQYPHIIIGTVICIAILFGITFFYLFLTYKKRNRTLYQGIRH